MKYNTVSTHCPCCKNDVIVRYSESAYNYDAYLDLKPISRSKLIDIVECPKCHFCGAYFDVSISPIQEAIVKSPRYQDIFMDSTISSDEQKARALVELAETDTDLCSSLMYYCWILEYSESTEAAHEIRKRAVDIQMNYLSKTMDFEILFQMIDSLRQLKRFEEAMQMIKKAKKSVESVNDKMMLMLIKYETVLISREDYLPHTLSEAAKYTVR